jgi:nicotinamidase-related amidase
MDAVRTAAAAAGQAREAGIPVVFTRHVYRPPRGSPGPLDLSGARYGLAGGR